MNVFNNRYFLNNKKCNIGTIWLMILLIFILIFLNIAFNYKYKNYDKYLGYVKNLDGFKVVLYVLKEDVSEIYKYNLLVDGLKYDYEIVSISEEYYIMDNQNYYEMVLDVPLNEKLLIENNLVNIVFEKNYTTFYSEFKKGIREWIK